MKNLSSKFGFQSSALHRKALIGIQIEIQELEHAQVAIFQRQYPKTWALYYMIAKVSRYIYFRLYIFCFP